MNALVLTAPERIRRRLQPKKKAELCRAAKRIRVEEGDPVETTATVLALKKVSTRALVAHSDAKELERELDVLVRQVAPQLLELFGVRTIVAAQVISSWSHRGRIRSEAAFAQLAGVAPLPASTGKSVRHRLNRGGDRQLNRAISTVVLTRLRLHQPTKEYADRRREEGKSKREIRRCLKRYVAREIFRTLERPNRLDDI